MTSGNQNGFVREVNPKGEVVCEVSLKLGEWPQVVQLIEVTPDKKVVWALRDLSTLGRVSSTQRLDDTGTAR